MLMFLRANMMSAIFSDKFLANPNVPSLYARCVDTCCADLREVLLLGLAVHLQERAVCFFLLFLLESLCM